MPLHQFLIDGAKVEYDCKVRASPICWRRIAVERNRLAHEIHDTMAHSFAGVGYQIQGIRSGILRGEHSNSSFIADQLSATYQLIRRCHVEASQTIAMQGSLLSPKRKRICRMRWRISRAGWLGIKSRPWRRFREPTSL